MPWMRLRSSRCLAEVLSSSSGRSRDGQRGRIGGGESQSNARPSFRPVFSKGHFALLSSWIEHDGSVLKKVLHVAIHVAKSVLAEVAERARVRLGRGARGSMYSAPGEKISIPK